MTDSVHEEGQCHEDGQCHEGTASTHRSSARRRSAPRAGATGGSRSSATRIEARLCSGPPGGGTRRRSCSQPWRLGVPALRRVGGRGAGGGRDTECPARLLMEKEGLSTAEVQVIHEPLGAASCRCRRAHPSGVILLPDRGLEHPRAVPRRCGPGHPRAGPCRCGPGHPCAALRFLILDILVKLCAAVPGASTGRRGPGHPREGAAEGLDILVKMPPRAWTSS